MIIDCATCPVQGTGCTDCVVTTLLDLTSPSVRASSRAVQSLAELDELVCGAGLPADGALLDAEERRALGVLVAAGLVPPMRPRFVTLGDDPPPERVGVNDDTPTFRRQAV